MENTDNYFVSLMNESNPLDEVDLSSPIGQQEFAIADTPLPRDSFIARFEEDKRWGFIALCVTVEIS
ncbi:hypothetical protein GUJ93_ZPchr0013g37690 [Zizania palustris]|uniref:Uncharacterized protein n=1 Tax=Zizania palustris TaxID=103762 RepID=A0A8J5X5P8_ZIZPA|nr:hypothetical protein GUJ93_ZPchr0013g37690 [Zizania palustris]